MSATVTDPISARTLPQFIRAIAGAYGDAPAVSLVTPNKPDETMSFAELDYRSVDLARGLLARSVGKGSRVAFMVGNGPDFAVIFAAIARIGAVAIPLSTLLKGEELVRVLRRSDVVGLIVQRTLLGHDLAERVVHALPEAVTSARGALRMSRVPHLRWVISTGEALPPPIEDLATLSNDGFDVSDVLLLAVEAEVHPTDQIVEIYTSGSMAQPKGVKHLHGPVLARASDLARMMGRVHGMSVPVPLPMFWVGGLGLFLLPNLVAGATTVCTEGTTTNSLSAMGTVLSEDELRPFAQARPYWALGMSETFGPYAWGDELRASGFPLCAPIDHVATGFEVQVVGEEGYPVADGERGEIHVRGYALTAGLHKIERSAYLTADGWYRTGDLGIREGARIHFVGRDGDIIKTAGSNVSPAEVEMEIQALEGVHSAYVVGLPDAERGQLVAAAVVPRDGVKLDFDLIQSVLRSRLSSYKVPRAYLAIARGEVPMLPSNKVARREIAAMLGRQLGREA